MTKSGVTALARAISQPHRLLRCASVRPTAAVTHSTRSSVPRPQPADGSSPRSWADPLCSLHRMHPMRSTATSCMSTEASSPTSASSLKPESVVRTLCVLNLMVISASCHSHFLAESWPHRSLNVARYVGERRCNQSSRNKDGL